MPTRKDSQPTEPMDRQLARRDAEGSGVGGSVRFVVVPFLPANQPALGVSSLLSVLQEQGIPGDIRYLNLEYGDRFGWDLYKLLALQMPNALLTGEMLFTQALWGERAASFEDYSQRVEEWLDTKLSLGTLDWRWYAEQWETHAEAIRTAMEQAPQVVSEWADAVLEGAPRVIGFTSTFQQSAAALALAQEVRRRVPAEEVAIFFGGANCEDDMGRAMSESFDFIDCVVSGESEGVIVELVEKVRAGETVPRFVHGSMVFDMDALPLPDFDDYFETATEPAYCGMDVHLAAESSRGCWWGVKSHCTFCGLNGGTMAFRKKSPERFASELETLSGKYGLESYSLTDNILDMAYLRTLLPELVAQGRSYKLFYETKANLRKDQVELLAAAGVYMLQPGIESLSTEVLKRMAKGTTRLQNVQLLKWCTELGVIVFWNILYGFPGEDPADYQDMAELLPALHHLPQPMAAAQIRLDRFGPYWKAPEQHGLCNVRQYWSYDLVFAGLPEKERLRLAYYFGYDYEDGRDPQTYAEPVIEGVSRWNQARARGARLMLRGSEDGPYVFDTRDCALEERFPMTPEGLALVRALDATCGRDHLGRAMAEQGVEIKSDELDRLVEDFLERRFAIEENGVLLGLIVDPREKRRVEDRQVALRCERMGLRWPEDFPDPTKQQIVRAAMLAMKPEKTEPAVTSAS